MKNENLKYLKAKKELETLMGMSSDEHFELIYDYGDRYLSNYFSFSPARANEWLTTRTFWVWFKRQWNFICYETLYYVKDFPVSKQNVRRYFIDKSKEIISKYPSKAVRQNIEDEILQLKIENLLLDTGVESFTNQSIKHDLKLN